MWVRTQAGLFTTQAVCSVISAHKCSAWIKTRQRADGQQGQEAGSSTDGKGDKSMLVAVAPEMPHSSALVGLGGAVEGGRHSKMNEILGQ